MANCIIIAFANVRQFAPGNDSVLWQVEICALGSRMLVAVLQ